MFVVVLFFFFGFIQFSGISHPQMVTSIDQKLRSTKALYQEATVETSETQKPPLNKKEKTTNPI